MSKNKSAKSSVILFTALIAFMIVVAVALVIATPSRHARRTHDVTVWHIPVPTFAPEPRLKPPAPPELAEPLSTPEPPPPIPKDPPVKAAPIAPVTSAPIKPVTTPISPLPEGTRPRIALVIDDMGLNRAGSDRAVRLPAPVTLSWIPYAPDLRAQTEKANKAGHELILHMPMEPLGKADPGPGALKTGMPLADIADRVNRNLSSFDGYDGVNNHMGSKFTADTAGMEEVLAILKHRNLFFLDSRTGPRSVGETTARRMGVPTASRDVFLDDDMGAPAIEKQLRLTLAEARRKGQAIAIGHPHPATLAALEAWIPEAEKAGFTFVPLRELIR